jgi:Zn-dependent metalloprotease
MNNKHCNCCFIVPKYVREHLEKEGYIDAKDSAQSKLIDEWIRDQREDRGNQLMAKGIAGIAAGNAKRFIFDCKHTKKLDKNLVRTEGQADGTDDDVNWSYENSGLVRDYYKNHLFRDSIDNHGMDLDMNVHFSTMYDNAFWNGSVMVFGDGDGKMFAHFSKGLDVIGHELTHGVVQYTCNLNQDEFPGTLNEHIADVFGTTIKQDFLKQTAATADWLIGDTIVLPAFPGKALRSLKAPGTAYTGDDQPDNMKNYKPWGGDPHLNNGIPNKAFYLVAAGDGTVNGIGTPAAAMLWYGALFTMKSDADFKDLYTNVRAQAVLQVKANKVPAGAAEAVDNAFKSVGII